MKTKCGFCIGPTGGGTRVITGLGFRPAVILFNNYTGGSPHRTGFGAAQDATPIVNVAAYASVSGGNSDSGYSLSKCIKCSPNEAAVTAIDDDGFTITWDAGANTCPVFWYAQDENFTST